MGSTSTVPLLQVENITADFLKEIKKTKREKAVQILLNSQK